MVHCGPLPCGEPRTGFCLHQEGEQHQEACWHSSRLAAVLTGGARLSSLPVSQTAPQEPGHDMHCPCSGGGCRLL
ncbi:hypothetical protein NDU88_004548 [Pleurodeles waltl]|uniref:Uncharacterized protein n=1 Tax=Pleurodeles waltl TaxID=8319 RepID=A0AAV7RLA6_PLEWA|nr:hypothetical protein NDU88_004548 [Pleurodeles waltl]